MPADGVYFITSGSGGAVVERYCVFSTAVNQVNAIKEFDFGSGGDGDINLNGGTHTIESLYSGYSWKDGKIPNWGTVTLTNGAVLTCSEYVSRCRVSRSAAPFRSPPHCSFRRRRVFVTLSWRKRGSSAGGSCRCHCRVRMGVLAWLASSISSLI